MTRDEFMVAVCTPRYVAGFIVRDNRVVKASPVLRYMIGWSLDRALAYVTKKNWEVEDDLRRGVQAGDPGKAN